MTKRLRRMETVDIQEAEKRFARLVDKAAAGEDVLVCRDGKPLVRITRLAPAKRPIRFGLLKGKIRIAADFDAYDLPGLSPSDT
jgi:prevent-host-death family protein